MYFYYSSTVHLIEFVLYLLNLELFGLYLAFTIFLFPLTLNSGSLSLFVFAIGLKFFVILYKLFNYYD